jgi:hypothetical protein
MKFSTREDIEAPIEHVFVQISDFAAFERRAMRQGADVKRMQDGDVAVGTSWEVAFSFRGRTRQVRPRLTRLEHPSGYWIETDSDGMTTALDVTLVPLSPSRTRILVAIELRARSLTSRLLLQSMKLAKGKLTKRFKARVLGFAEDVEDEYRHRR